jgi:hypothetical protein
MMTLRTLWQRLCGGGDAYIPHWTEARAARAEQDTYRMLGIRPDTHYPWSRQFRRRTRPTLVQKCEQNHTGRKQA